MPSVSVQSNLLQESLASTNDFLANIFYSPIELRTEGRRDMMVRVQHLINLPYDLVLEVGS